jgi:SAM-dependent methyltransferase
MIQRLKGAVLKLFTNYESDPRSYWDLRWRLHYDDERGLDVYRDRWKAQVTQLMQDHDCGSILDVGCGKAWLRSLYGYLGVDSSVEVFRQNNLRRFLVADASEVLPLPSKSFDAVASFFFLMHLSPGKAEVASGEMMRVAKRLIVIREGVDDVPSLKFHCFKHDYDKLFRSFDGDLEMLGWK